MVKSFGSGDWEDIPLTADAISAEGHSLPGHQAWKNRLVSMMIAKLKSRHDSDWTLDLTPEMFEIKGPVRIHHRYSETCLVRAYPPGGKETVEEMELDYRQRMDDDIEDMGMLDMLDKM
jgi:hypothetical protein